MGLQFVNNGAVICILNRKKPGKNLPLNPPRAPGATVARNLSPVSENGSPRRDIRSASGQAAARPAAICPFSRRAEAFLCKIHADCSLVVHVIFAAGSIHA